VLSHELFHTDLPQALVSAFEATDARYLEEGARRAAEAAAATAAAASEAAATSSSPRSTPPPQPPNRTGFYYYYGAGGARSPGASCRSPGGGCAGGINGHLVTAATAPPGEDGSTAVVAVLLPDGTLAVANAGDSRAVLMRNGRAHTLSVDHKPNLREERLRIEKAGGAVLWSGVWRVGLANGVGGTGGGLLALSRAFGDRPLKLGAGVVATPDGKMVRLGAEDRVLVLASDGLFDVMNAQEALMIADGQPCASSAARKLAHEALERGTMDNVSAVVVKLAFGAGEGERAPEVGVATSTAAAT
jgi:serine/threonine protein phosphatase PrpC